MKRCARCGAPLNPVAAMLGPVCGACVRTRHAEAATGRPADASEALRRARVAWRRTSQQQLELDT